ncbi:hypothetical protein [cyanobacterium endosymbiont of Epithemia turgida]|uniref:hypothetical protein n=1 Tax=cyanobacterium endosymbiont of Epithemia turgida TaxID=718217 RepID=UPI001494AA07|nr:hypothetical protein [cyanobacterium endosymbiont of Epithemia turgida]
MDAGGELLGQIFPCVAIIANYSKIVAIKGDIRHFPRFCSLPTKPLDATTG